MRVCQFRHFGLEGEISKEQRHYSRDRIQLDNRKAYWVAAGDAAGAAGEDSCVGAGVGVDAGAVSGFDCNTDRPPLRTPDPSISAINMNAAAAPIVIFASRLAVPRGPNAVLDKVFENNAPASALPG